MTALWTLCGLGFCTLAALLVLREIRRDFSPYLLLGFAVVVFGVSLPRIGEMIAFVRDCMERTESAYLASVLEALGVTYLAHTAAELCRTAGEGTLGSVIETAGRVELVLLCLPLFRALLELALAGV